MVYMQTLQDKGADNTLIDTRVKLAKILLMRLRDAPTGNQKAYRIAVDLTLPLFKADEIKQLFLLVIREFYYFWVDNENALKECCTR